MGEVLVARGNERARNAPRKEPAIDGYRAWARRDWLALAIVTLGALLLRLVDLSHPAGFVFDEIHYARSACRFVVGTSQCGIGELVSGSYPPLGNWMIGIGIKLFGFNEFGWRIVSALAGTLTVPILYVLMRRLLTGHVMPVAATIGAAAAAALLAVDFLHLVQSRVAMLDSFVTLFVIVTVLLAVLDGARERDPAGNDAHASAWLRRLTLGRPWRLATGLSLGAAAAVKWSGAYMAIGLVALVVIWEVASTPRGGNTSTGSWRAGFTTALRRELLPSVVLLGLVPLAVYLASYIGRVHGDLLAAPWQEGSVWHAIASHQVAMLRFHLGLAGHHPYESPAWSWLLLKRPAAYSFATDSAVYREVLALGNPLTWWTGAIALLGLTVGWVRRGAALARAEPVLVAGALGTYLPWLVLSGARSQVFIWYILPSIPFLYGALGLLAARAWGSLRGRVAVGLAGVAVLASFAFFYPILTAQAMTPDEWRTRIWFTDCSRPGAPTLTVPDDEISTGPPPSGWCWI